MQEFSSFDKQYKKKAALVPVEEMAPYAIDDVLQLHRLYPILGKELDKVSDRLPDIFRRLEMPTLWEILRMERNGFLIDKGFLKAAAIKLDLAVDELGKAIASDLRLPLDEIKLGSTQWLSRTLIDEMRVWGMPPEGRGKTGHFSTATANLEKWAAGAIPGTSAAGRRIAEKIVNLRRYAKLRSTYTLTLIDHADEHGRIHASFNQAGTATGRFSSSNPNLQNIPRPNNDPDLPQIRGAFIARPGWKIIDIDYSQIELRLMAHFSRDPNMLRIYSEGGDIHQMTADACGCSRQHAKGINFGLLYRMWYKKLAIVLSIPEADARMYWDRYFRQYPGVARFQDLTEERAAHDGFITTLIGRVRMLPDIHSPDKMKSSMARRQSINTKIQGSAGDLIKLGMRNIGREIRKRGWDDRLLIVSQVHDELIFECEDSIVEEAAQMVKNKLETVVELRVPLIAEPSIAQTWLEAK
jgi:DNA polymerase-1